jgi:hypothetical protein
MPIRDEQYANDWANARVISNVRGHCSGDYPMDHYHNPNSEAGMWDRDTDHGLHGEESQYDMFQRRLRSGIGSGWNPRLR